MPRKPKKFGSYKPEVVMTKPPMSGGLLNLEELPIAVRAARGTCSLREASADSGVSFATLSRVEDGAMPNVPTLRALSAWLSRPVVVTGVRPTCGCGTPLTDGSCSDADCPAAQGCGA